MGDEMDQPIIKTSPYASPLHNFASSIVQMTSTESEILDFELTLRGQILNGKGDIVQIGEPLLNDIGIRKIIGMVRSVASRISVMSNYDKRDIEMYMIRNGNALIIDLMLNREKYDIGGNPTATRTLIIENFNNVCHSTLKRGFEEGDKRFWKGSQQEIISRVESSQSSKKGLMSSLFGWGGK